VTRASVLCALAMLVLPAASARSAPPSKYDPKAAFAEADQNKDGMIEIGEFYDRLVDVFFLDDTDKNGSLSHDEFIAAIVIEEPFADVDRNGDGKISKQEFVRSRLPLFRSSDTNGDGMLSLEEVTAAYQKGKK
jgi:Ca2+-binding EF-hand superfamily protein